MEHGRIAPHLGGRPESERIEGRASLIGSEAPEFQLRDEEGTFVTLRRLTRRLPLLLYLYRGAW